MRAGLIAGSLASGAPLSPTWVAKRTDGTRERAVFRSRIASVEVFERLTTLVDEQARLGPRLLITLGGAVQCQTADGDLLLDVNTILMSPAGRMREPDRAACGDDYRTILIAPNPSIWRQLFGNSRPSRRPASSRLKLLAHRLARLDGAEQPQVAQALTHALLNEVAVAPVVHPPRRSRTVEDVKILLHRFVERPWTLSQLAEHVGVSAPYLTQEFSRAEGLPLYRYQKQLRLSRALYALPACRDITGLALELGFSSHSHFTAAFRQEFALTPSDFRAEMSGSEGCANGANKHQAWGTQ